MLLTNSRSPDELSETREQTKARSGNRSRRGTANADAEPSLPEAAARECCALLRPAPASTQAPSARAGKPARDDVDAN